MNRGYRKRLAQDLERWIAAGLVPENSRKAILADIAPEPARWSAQGAAAILGAVLLALAALSFVAANWADLSRIMRFAVIIAALWASYAGAALAFARNQAAAGQALALLGAALFGGAIALTAQTFNLSAYRNTGVLIWAIGALATALAIPSRPVLILSAGLGGAWLIAEAQNPLAPAILWAYPALFVITAAAASRLQSNVTMNLLAAGLGWWLAHTLHETVGDFDGVTAAATFALVSGAIALIAAALRDRGVAGAGVQAGWGAAGAAAGAFLLQLGVGSGGAEPPGAAYLAAAAPAFILAAGLAALQVRAGRLRPWAALSLIAAALACALLPYALALGGEGLEAVLEFALGALVFAAGAVLILIGAKPERRTAGAVGVVLFTAQAIYVYVELFGGLLGTAAFFAVGGVLMIALSVIVTRVARRLGQGASS